MLVIACTAVMATAMEKHSPLAWIQVTSPPWQDKRRTWTMGYFYSEEKQGGCCFLDTKIR